MTWGWPLGLWLLILVPVALGLRLLWGFQVRQQQAGVGSTSRRHLAARLPLLAAVRLLLLWSGLFLGLLALAQPRWGVQESPRQAIGANIAVLLDCSRSMLAEDQFPDRLEAARRKIIDLLRASPEHRIALIPFAAFPLRRSPLTGDQVALERLLEGCTPGLFPVQGTAIGTAVGEAVEFLEEQGDRGRAIVVFSDGSDPDRDSVEAAARRAAVADIPVYGVFFGDPERRVTLEIDGREQVMEADRSTLDLLAETTDAISVNVRPDDADIRALQQDIDGRVPQVPWEEEERRVASERYFFFLWPALALIAVGALCPTGRRRRPMWEVQ